MLWLPDPTFKKVKHSITLPRKKNDWILIVSHLFYFKSQNPSVDRWPTWSNASKKGRWPWNVNHTLCLSLVLLFIDQYLFFFFQWVELSSDYCGEIIGKTFSQRCSSEEAMSPSSRAEGWIRVTAVSHLLVLHHAGKLLNQSALCAVVLNSAENHFIALQCSLPSVCICMQMGLSGS